MIDVDAGWRQAPTRKVYTCDRADRDRRVEAWVGVVIGGSMMLGFILLAFVYSITPNVVLVVSAGLSLVLSGAGRFVLCSRIRESPSRWRRGDGAVEFGPCWGFLLWEQMPPLTLTIGVALALRMPFPPGAIHSDVTRSMRLALGLLAAAVLMWAFMPVNPPRNPELILEPNGMWLWPGGRHREYIPWELDPVVEGRLGRHFPRAVITRSRGRPASFPIVPIPLGYVQLQRVVEFYSAHPELRDELATDAGLERVRLLMYTPIWRVEEELPPISSSEFSAGHEREPHETLVSADIVPPAMNDRPIPPDARESSDLEPLSEASRPPVPSGALSCEKADRKNANAPLRILLYIIIAALPLFTYDTAGQNTALTLLCPTIILIILLHVPILWMVDIPIARAPRRWVRDAGGIALPGFWPFPLARQIGALLFALLGLLVYYLVLSDRSIDEDYPVQSLCIATACLVIAVVIWSRTPRPRLGAGITLTPEGFRVSPGTRHESAFMWQDGPRIVGASRSGSALILTASGSALTAVRMAPIPLSYVQLQRVVEFYTTHPELRRELADDAGLTRVRALMRTPVWRIERTLRPTPPMRPEPQAPWTLDCEAADRRRSGAPRRAILWALGALAGLVAIAITGRETTMIALLAVVFILMLLRVAVLRVFQIRLDHADRHWTTGRNGIELPSFWLAPLLTRLGAGTLALISFVCFALTTTARPSEEQFRIPSVLAAAVCLAMALTVWRNTGRPHPGPEIILTPENFRIAPGTRHETVFRWDGRPCVVGASTRSGRILIGHLLDPDAGLARLPIDAFTTGYTQLQHVIDVYSDHPELRDELATDAGLTRVRALMRASI